MLKLAEAVKARAIAVFAVSVAIVSLLYSETTLCRNSTWEETNLGRGQLAYFYWLKLSLFVIFPFPWFYCLTAMRSG